MLADLRPNTKAIAELRELFGEHSPALRGVGEVGLEWREAHVLAPALAMSDGELCDLDSGLALRHQLAIGAMASAGHAVGHHRREQRLDRT